MKLNNFDLEEHFYHSSLRALKVCNLSRKGRIYKELLASYFQYLDALKIVPALDICKLVLDALELSSSILANGQ